MDAVINHYGNEAGEFRTVTSLLSPNGVVDFLAKNERDFQQVRVVKKRMGLPKVRYDFTWIPYLLAISYIAIFLYPHESIGRYAIIVDKEGTTSQQAYKNKVRRLKFILEQCKEACARLEEIVDSE